MKKTTGLVALVLVGGCGVDPDRDSRGPGFASDPGPISASGPGSDEATDGPDDDDDDDDGDEDGDTSAGGADSGPKLDVGDDDDGGDLPGPAACDASEPDLAPGDCAALGIVIHPPFDEDYACVDLGPAPAVPTPWGGLTNSLDDDDVLLIGGAANTAEGLIYSLNVARDSTCHVLGFVGDGAVYSEGAYNEGGVVHGPEDVLFLARWPINELGQVLPGSTTTDKVIDMAALGVAESTAGVYFVPSGFPGAGRLKLASWPGGEWYDVAIAPDAAGTFDVTGLTHETTITGGPEGYVYLTTDNPGITAQSLLVSEWPGGDISLYQLDDGGDPLPETRTVFLSGVGGAEGAHIDPKSGDFLFSTFGGIERVIAIQGFVPPPPPAG